MHTSHGLTADLQEALEALEASIERPLRVLYARGRTFTNEEWTLEQAANCETLLAECIERGVTLVRWGTLHEVRYQSVIGLTAGDQQLFTDAMNPGALYDVLKMPDDKDEWLADPLIVGNTTFGEIAERLVLIGFDFGSLNGLNHEALFVEPIKLACDPDFTANATERRANIDRDRYLKYALRASHEEVMKVQTEVGDLMRARSNHEQQLTRVKLDLRGKQHYLDVMLKHDAEEYGNTEEKLLADWVKLLADERIVRVCFLQDEKLLIETAGLDFTNPDTGQTVYLGKFRWYIQPTSCLIEVHNLDNARGGFDHPHIFMNRPCFGEMGETLYTLIRQGDLFASIEMIFAFLSSINLHDDWARRAAFWFNDAEDSPRNTPDTELVTA